MKSLLVVSPDFSSAEAIRRKLGAEVSRFRQVDSAAAALYWLSAQRFDVLLLDARFYHTEKTELLTSAWRQQPALVAGIFDLREQIHESWDNYSLGLRVFSGQAALDEIQSCLRRLPDSSSITQSYFAALLVEDLDSPRDIISAYLESLGCARVDAASSADEAFSLLQEKTFDYFCAVTDINMPGTNGIDFIRNVRKAADREVARIPIIVLTSSPTRENLLAAIEAGASGFVAKPPKRKLLASLLQKARRAIISGQLPRISVDGS